MATQLFAKLLELAYNEVKSDLDSHEKVDRLIDALLGKNLTFKTDEGEDGEIVVHNIGQGKKKPSTLVTLQIKGIKFYQDPQRLTLDLRYIYYQEYGHAFCFGTPVKFLLTSPMVRKLGPSNILIEFVLYGDTVSQVNRCLSIFADVVRMHQTDPHQTAIDKYDNEGSWESSPDIELSEPLREIDPLENPLEHVSQRVNDEVYIKEYIQYIDNPEGEMRRLIDNRNTFAESKM